MRLLEWGGPVGIGENVEENKQTFFIRVNFSMEKDKGDLSKVGG